MEHRTLKEKSIVALVWDFVGSLATQGSQFVISIILARLLSPSDFGLVGMAMVFIAISQSFIDLGFGSALVQNKENKPITYSSIFLINLFCGIVLLMLFIFLAKPIGGFYESKIVEQLVLIMAPTLLFGALNMVQISILKRELRFKELSLRLLLSGLISGLIGVTLAFLGYGVYALSVQVLFFSIISTIVLWKVSEWRPTLDFSLDEVKSLLSFSTYTFLGQTLNQIINKLDALIIGKLFSASTLGFFTRAESLGALLISYTSGSLAKVFFPAMSKIQDDLERFKYVFLKVISLVSFLTFLLSGVMILSGEFIILTLFGEKWQPSVVIFQILMVKIFCYPISVIIVNSFKAIGKAKEDFWYGNIRKTLRIIPFVIAYYYGFTAFLYALVIITIIGTLFNNVIASIHFEIPFGIQIKSIYQFALYFILALIPSYYYFYSLVDNQIIDLIIRNLLFLIIFLSFVKIFNNSVFQEIKNHGLQLLGMAKKKITFLLSRNQFLQIAYKQF